MRLCLGSGPVRSNGVDLEAVTELAGRLELESVLLESVAGAGATGVRPLGRDGWVAELRDRVVSNAARNLQQDEATEEVLEECSRRAIPTLLLKGGALRARQVGLAGRYQCDVDLLVPRARLPDAEDVLERLGYRIEGCRRTYLRNHFHVPYRRGDTLMELHWDIDYRTPVGALDRIWGRSRPANGASHDCRIPSSEHQLLICCVHLSRHGFLAGLRWMVDIRRVSSSLEAEGWRRFDREARYWPRRALRFPIWLLESWKDRFGWLPRGPGWAGRTDLGLARSLALRHLLSESWAGLPLWLTVGGLERWLFSGRSLLGLLGRGFLEHRRDRS